MSESFYDQIHADAPCDTAGGLHEQIWTDLLERTEVRFQNVRLTRGDGGLDGVAFREPYSEEVSVFQAKCFPCLSSEAKTDEKRRKEAIIDSFITAMSRNFQVASWTLLVPFSLNHKDLDWLLGDLAKTAEAQIEQSDRKQEDKNKTLANIKRCQIQCYDATRLRLLLQQHLDICALRLPSSRQALASSLAKARQELSEQKQAVAFMLKEHMRLAVANRAFDTRKAYAALTAMLATWSPILRNVELLKDNHYNSFAPEVDVSTQVIDAVRSTTQLSLFAELICPGIAEACLSLQGDARDALRDASNYDYTHSEEYKQVQASESPIAPPHVEREPDANRHFLWEKTNEFVKRLQEARPNPGPPTEEHAGSVPSSPVA